MSRIGKVSVAVVSWNGREHLEICLAALAEQADPGVGWEILLFDNGSGDGSSEWVRRHYPGVRLIESPSNLGFASANNRLARAATGDAVAFLNNDTRPTPEWLRSLVGALAAAPADVAAVSGQIVDWAGERLDFARGVMTFDGHAFQLDFRRRLDQVQVPAAGAELLFACGGNMLVRRASFLAAGGFDEAFFAYLEDVDLGWRLWAGGERIAFAPEALVHHRSSATSDLLGLYHRGFLFERNAFLTAYQNYEPGLWERIMPLVMLTLTARTQTLLVGSNPGGESLAVDPYAGLIADTAAPAGSPPARRQVDPGSPSGERLLAGLRRRWRDYGTLELARRGLTKGLGSLRARRSAARPLAPELTDERTVAQLRAVSYLLAHLDAAAVRRREIQARRRRSDREIFERFPLYLVPTYPGDEELFARPGFGAWLPPDLPLVRSSLGEVMELDP